jgi:2-iminobutanoate/2-iminopropanoate deaminase
MKFFTEDQFKAARLPFSQSVRVGDIVYLSGCLGNLPGTTTLAPGGMEGEVAQTMANVAAALKPHGLGFDDIFKCTVMIADIARWAEFNTYYVTYFKPDRMPARSAFGANGLALGALVELECWAYAGKK